MAKSHDVEQSDPVTGPYKKPESYPVSHQIRKRLSHTFDQNISTCY